MSKDEHLNESIISQEAKAFLAKENRSNHMEYMPDMEVLDSDLLDRVVADMDSYDYDSYTAQDVRRALQHSRKTPEDFRALLSPAALPFWKKLPSRPRWKRKSILAIQFVSLPLSILLITVKTSVSTVALTATTTFVEPSLPMRRLTRKWQPSLKAVYRKS